MDENKGDLMQCCDAVPIDGDGGCEEKRKRGEKEEGEVDKARAHGGRQALAWLPSGFVEGESMASACGGWKERTMRRQEHGVDSYQESDGVARHGVRSSMDPQENAAYIVDNRTLLIGRIIRSEQLRAVLQSSDEHAGCRLGRAGAGW